MQVNANGFPEYGIHLHLPADTIFAEMVAVLAQANPDRKDEIEALRPYSLVIRYDGIPNIIGYAIKWDMVTSEGDLHPGVRTNMYSVGHKVTIPATGSLPSHLRGVMRRGSFWFCSPMYQPEEIPVGNKNQKIESGSGMGEGSFEGFFQKVQPELVMAAFKAYESGDPTLLRMLRVKQLANYSSITFSMDGVLFDDGTMIGANTSGFFERVNEARSKSPYISNQQ